MYRKPTVFFNIILPVLLALLFLFLYIQRAGKANEIALGKDAKFYTPIINGYPIMIMELEMADSMYKGWEARGSKEVTLWLGNSQLSGLNQYKMGQKNSVEFLFDSLRLSRQEAIGASFPNGNFQEFLVAAMYLTGKFKVKNLVVPAFYDDMRESGIRNEMKILPVIKYIKSKELKKYYDNVPGIIEMEDTTKNVVLAASDMGALEQTAQEHSERYLNRIAEKNWSIWAKRPNVRAKIFNDIYLLRNYVLGITPGTVRKMIPGRYTDNYNAFLKMLQYCTDNGIRVFVYIPPLRNDFTPPYDMSEYRRFKQSVRDDCSRLGAEMHDFDNLVPAKYWGKHTSSTIGDEEEIDFMHFQEPGHHLLADTIFKIFKEHR